MLSAVSRRASLAIGSFSSQPIKSLAPLIQRTLCKSAMAHHFRKSSVLPVETPSIKNATFIKVDTPFAPKAIGPYSQAVTVKNFSEITFVSGQLPLDLETGTIVDPTISGQTQLVLDHIRAILKESGKTFADVAFVNIFLKDMNDFNGMNKVYERTFEEAKILPPRFTVQVAKLPKDALVEIACYALK